MKNKITAVVTSLVLLAGSVAPVMAAETQTASQNLEDKYLYTQVIEGEEISFYGPFAANEDDYEMTRASYTVSGTLTLSTAGVTCYPYIVIDANTGYIGSHGMTTNNSNLYCVYNIGFNNTSYPTIAYFTITAYTRNFFGGMGYALETGHVTLKSAGPI
ncbi:MAG: hypothetical protein HUJ54_13340 [Erysipelotrichaceae bacterium]|nr:hypothetical protein [Erysipelotrichaceae bacterium]